MPGLRCEGPKRLMSGDVVTMKWMQNNFHVRCLEVDIVYLCVGVPGIFHLHTQGRWTHSSCHGSGEHGGYHSASSWDRK